MHIDSLVPELEKLLAEKNGCEIHATPFWQDICQALIRSALRQSPRDFLMWDAVNLTMHPKSSPLFEPWYRYLRSLNGGYGRWCACFTEDPVGNPVGFHLDPGTSPLLIQHGYHIVRFQSATGCDPLDHDVVIEIGGGYGSMARLFYRMGFTGRYLIFDMPPVSVLQRLYLQDVGLSVSETMDHWQQVFCCTDVADLSRAMKTVGPRGGLAIATFSLSEMPGALREEIGSIIRCADGFLVAYQAIFEGLDNHPYFSRFVKKSSPDMVWYRSEIDGLPQNYYLFGHHASIDGKTQPHNMTGSVHNVVEVALSNKEGGISEG